MQVNFNIAQTTVKISSGITTQHDRIQMHNAASSRPLCRLISTFGRALLLTATVPKALEEGLEFSRQYTLQVPEAIERGIITDYKVIVPIITECNADRARIATGERAAQFAHALPTARGKKRALPTACGKGRALRPRAGKGRALRPRA